VKSCSPPVCVRSGNSPEVFCDFRFYSTDASTQVSRETDARSQCPQAFVWKVKESQLQVQNRSGSVLNSSDSTVLCHSR
jgi:hypothetical protein